MSNYSSSFDYNEYDNDKLCNIQFIRDIEMKSMALSDEDNRKRREECCMSCGTCICVVIFVAVTMYVALRLFEFYNIEPATNHSNSSHLENKTIH